MLTYQQKYSRLLNSENQIEILNQPGLKSLGFSVLRLNHIGATFNLKTFSEYGNIYIKKKKIVSDESFMT